MSYFFLPSSAIFVYRSLVSGSISFHLWPRILAISVTGRAGFSAFTFSLCSAVKWKYEVRGALGAFGSFLFLLAGDATDFGTFFLPVVFSAIELSFVLASLTGDFLGCNWINKLICVFYKTKPSIHYVKKKDWLGLENGQFCWRSVLYLCWHIGQVGISWKFCWRDKWMVSYYHSDPDWEAFRHHIQNWDPYSLIYMRKLHILFN